MKFYLPVPQSNLPVPELYLPVSNLTCVYLYLPVLSLTYLCLPVLVKNEGRNEEGEKERGIEVRKEGFWFLCRNLAYLYLLKFKLEEKNEKREKE